MRRAQLLPWVSWQGATSMSCRLRGGGLLGARQAFHSEGVSFIQLWFLDRERSRFGRAPRSYEDPRSVAAAIRWPLPSPSCVASARDGAGATWGIWKGVFGRATSRLLSRCPRRHAWLRRLRFATFAYRRLGWRGRIMRLVCAITQSRKCGAGSWYRSSGLTALGSGRRPPGVLDY